MSHDIGNGCRAELVKLKGKAGWAAKMIVDGRHKATVADPEDGSKEGALLAAQMWGIMYREQL